MKLILSKTILVCALLFSVEAQGKSYVTYSGSGGRLGDNLVAFLHAAYVAYVYDLQLLYTHFNYFDQLALSKMFAKQSDLKNTALKVKHFAPHEKLSISQDNNIVYVIPYFPAGDYDRNHCNCFKFDCDWNNKEFLTFIRSAVRPLSAFAAPTLEDYKIHIALHIRRGGGADAPLYNRMPSSESAESLTKKRVPPPGAYADTGYPMKFPPVAYYIQQLKKIIQMCAPSPIHVHLFTDDTDPGSLVARIKSELNYNVEFTWRTSGNYHNRNVLEDLFTMPHFDILLRSDSNYAVVAEKLKDYLLVVSPVDYVWQGEKLVITKQKIRINSGHKKYRRITRDDSWLAQNFAQIENVNL